MENIVNITYNQTGASSNVDEFGMREMQRMVYEQRHRQYLLVKAPPACGKSGRARWYIANKNVITTGVEYLNKWKVIVSSANAGGQKRSNQIAVIDNYSAFGRSRVALKTFDTEQEARNFLKYATSEIIRFAFLLTDESLTSLAKKVPDIENYTDQNGLIDFMKDFIPSKDCFMLFDGTAMICNSSHINDAQRGYNSHGCHDPQINLIYAVAIREEKLMPVFYKRYPVSVRDVSAFANLRNEMGVKDIVAICDEGFSKKSDQTLMEECGIDYLMPLKRNNNEYTKEPLYKPGFMGFQGRFLYNGRIIWYYEQPSHEEDKHKYFLFLDETLQHLELSNIKQSFDIGNETPEELTAITEHQLLYGTICLKTSLKSYSAETVFKTYKMREEIEQLFGTYKCEEHFNTTGMHSPETQESCPD